MSNRPLKKLTLMTNCLSKYTDRELLEQIYIMLISLTQKVNEINDDNKQFSLNLAADLMGDMLNYASPLNRR